VTTTISKLRDQLLQTVDNAIEKGRWDNSLFLKNILKQLQELREYIIKELGETAPTEVVDIQQRIRKIIQEKEGYQRVYIALYQTESDRLDRWLVTIKLLAGGYSVSRPIYASETEIQSMLREKNGKGDAYVVVWVKQSDILPPQEGMPLKDRWGHDLLHLKDSFFRLENVIEFVLNGRRYHLADHGLKLSDL